MPRAQNADGSAPSCSGYNCSGSEIGHLWYTELGNQATVVNGNQGLFRNMVRDGYGYWTETYFNPDPQYQWYFSFAGGFQNLAHFYTNLYAVAVRDGDVLGGPPAPPPPRTDPQPLPEPYGLALLLTARGAAAWRRSVKPMAPSRPIPASANTEGSATVIDATRGSA